MRHERLALAFLHADGPRAAVHLQQDRRLGVGGQVGALPHVEVVPATRVAVAEVACGEVALADAHVGPQQLLTRERDLGPRRERLGDAVAVVGAEFVDQRLFQDLAGLTRLAMDVHEPGERRRVRSEAERATPSTRAAATGEQRTGGELEQADLHRQFRRRDAEGERRHRRRA